MSAILDEVLAILKARGPMTSMGVRTFLPQYTGVSVRSALTRLRSTGRLDRVKVVEGGRGVSCYRVAVPPEKPVRVREGEEPWVPSPWIHPIRRRVLALPVATAPLTELRRTAPRPTDFAHPIEARS